MPSSPDARADVADQLTKLSAPGAPLHRDSTESTHHRYPITDTARARFHNRAIDWYLGLHEDVRGERRAVVTAGAPGSGKSTLVRTRIPDVDDEYRVIDADRIKDYLIEQALADGIYDHLLSDAPLADGHRLAPRELSALVHEESANLADRIRRICVGRQENVVIEGTLTWAPQGPKIFQELADNDYLDVEVYGIDVDRATAHQQAVDRWWADRVRWARGEDALGGRFTPVDAIDVCYPAVGVESICVTHAKGFINSAIQSGDIRNVQVTILRPIPGPAHASQIVYYRAYRV